MGSFFDGARTLLCTFTVTQIGQAIQMITSLPMDMLFILDNIRSPGPRGNRSVLLAPQLKQSISL